MVCIMRPIAQQIITDINKRKCIKEVGLRCVIESRVATAGMLMHKNPSGRNDRPRKGGPHRPGAGRNLERDLQR